MLGHHWRADRARYGDGALTREISIWAVAAYRFGRSAQAMGGVRGRVLTKVAWQLHRLAEVVTGVSLPLGATIGPGLRIHHFGGVIVHNDARIGANCTMRQGVTIGDRHVGGEVPVLEDDVEIGAYAQILGGITVGRGARIGAMSVVLHDVPPGATAVGAPARIVRGGTQP